MKKKVGPDGITSKIHKDAFEVIENRFLDFINNSLSTGVANASGKMLTNSCKNQLKN